MLGPVSESVFGEQDLLNLNLLAIGRFPGFNEELEEAAGHPTGDRTRRCRGRAGSASTTSVGSGPDNFVIPCNMNGNLHNADEGASGGPWLTGDDQIGAVNSTSESCSVFALFCTKDIRGAQFASAALSLWFNAVNDFSTFTP